MLGVYEIRICKNGQHGDSRKVDETLTYPVARDQARKVKVTGNDTVRIVRA